MKTPDEIKKGLACCIAGCCGSCPYEDYCFSDNESMTERKSADALTLIQQLEEDRKERDILADAYQELESAQPKWISADNPPKMDGSYIVFLKTNSGKTFKGLDYYDVFNGWRCEGWYDGRYVVYWMPFDELPEPPKEGEP